MAQSSRDFSHPALLLIDMQNAYFESAALADKRAVVIANCNRLVHTDRRVNVPVFNVRTEHKRDGSTWTLKMLEDRQGYLFEGTEQVRNLAELDLAGSTEIIKRRDSAFWNTELLTRLLQHRVTSLILAGVSSPTCVAATAKDAFAANLAVAIIHDAVASEDPDFEEHTLDFARAQHRQQVESTTGMIGRMTGSTDRSPTGRETIMSLNNSEFDDIRRNQDPDEPLDGRDGQPATEGSSDVPHTLENEDPLRSAESVIARNDELKFDAADGEPDDGARVGEEPLAGQEADPGLDGDREVLEGDRREDPDLP